MGEWCFDDGSARAEADAEGVLQNLPMALPQDDFIPASKLLESLAAMRMGVKVLAKDPKRFHPEYVLGYKAAIRTFEEFIGWDVAATKEPDKAPEPHAATTTEGGTPNDG